MRQILPYPPINGLSFSRLWWNALIWKGYVTLIKGDWIINNDTFDLDDREMELILREYLSHRDQ